MEEQEVPVTSKKDLVPEWLKIALIILVGAACGLVILHYLPTVIAAVFSFIAWIWNVLYFNTIGLPFWWLSSETGYLPLSPGTIAVLFTFYCFLLLAGSGEDGIVFSCISYVILFVFAFTVCP